MGIFNQTNPTGLPHMSMGPKPKKAKAETPEPVADSKPFNTNSPASYLAKKHREVLNEKERATVVEYMSGYYRLQNLMIALGPDAVAERHKVRKMEMINRGDVAGLESLKPLHAMQSDASSHRNAIYQRMVNAFTKAERKLIYDVLDRAEKFFVQLPAAEVERQKQFCEEIGVPYQPCPATRHLLGMAAKARSRADALKADQNISAGEANMLSYLKGFVTDDEMNAITAEARAAAEKQPMPVAA